MIGIDTNILLRLWLNDDRAPNQRIDALLAKHGGTLGSLLVTDVVLAEAVWTLLGVRPGQGCTADSGTEPAGGDGVRVRRP
jgi:predicted nucleic-acid-binding protein